MNDIDNNLVTHHIDWNNKNNNVDNLIEIPKKIHQLVHEYLGYVNREELLVLVKMFNSSSNYKNKSAAYLNLKLSKYVDTEKSSELATSCRNNLDKIKEPNNKNNHIAIYKSVYGNIKKGWHIHHIDWNHENNNINNLIEIPKKIHQLVHKYLGYVNREEFELLLKAWNDLDLSDASVGYINHHLSKYVNSKKRDKLSVKCKAMMDYDIIRYQNAFDWRDGKVGLT